jgi:hypothetical protein
MRKGEGKTSSFFLPIKEAQPQKKVAAWPRPFMKYDFFGQLTILKLRKNVENIKILLGIN